MKNTMRIVNFIMDLNLRTILIYVGWTLNMAFNLILYVAGACVWALDNERSGHDWDYYMKDLTKRVMTNERVLD